MKLLTSFRSELTKIKESSAWILTFVASAVTPCLMVLFFDSD